MSAMRVFELLELRDHLIHLLDCLLDEDEDDVDPLYESRLLDELDDVRFELEGYDYT